MFIAGSNLPILLIASPAPGGRSMVVRRFSENYEHVGCNNCLGVVMKQNSYQPTYDRLSAYDK